MEIHFLRVLLYLHIISPLIDTVSLIVNTKLLFTQLHLFSLIAP